MRALLLVAIVPDWVRKDLAVEDDNEPPLSDKDAALLRAQHAYQAMPRRPREKQEARITRFIAENAAAKAVLRRKLMTRSGLEYFLSGQGRPYTRLSKR